MKVLLAVAILVAFLIATLVISIFMWSDLGDVEISFHGMLALALGVIVTLGLGIGLMALVFYSNRRGYDDRANR